MTSDLSDLVRPASDQPGAVEEAFRAGSAVVLRWRRAYSEITAALRTVERYLSTLPVETSFPGADDLAAHRQTLWVAATGLGRSLSTEPSDIAHLDGDVEGGARGLAMLRRHPEATAALARLKHELDAGLRAAVDDLGLRSELPADCLDEMTVRYRAIRYAPGVRGVAGIGMHPDGNVISALITDQPGLVVLGGLGRVEWPDPEAGTVVMPGTILTRWSDGHLPPTPHAVSVGRGDPTKCSVVAFLNFADGADVPRSARLTGRTEPFRNDVSRHKRDDMRPDGDLAGFYRDRGFVVPDRTGLRFRSVAELMTPGLAVREFDEPTRLRVAGRAGPRSVAWRFNRITNAVRTVDTEGLSPQTAALIQPPN
jgi:hypothetical protein